MTLAEIGTLAARLANSALARAIGSDFITQAGDGAISIAKDATYYITKGSAAALTVAAPGADNIGRVITLLTGSDFAHVTTFTGATLQDGTAGANSTWTATAVQGCALTFRAVTATKWTVVSFNLGTIAP